MRPVRRSTPDAYMSRVFTIVGMISKGGMPFGSLIYGIILSKIQLRWVTTNLGFVFKRIIKNPLSLINLF